MSNFNYEIINNEAVITKYSGSSNLVFIPDKIDGISVTSIGEGVFKDNKRITSVRLPKQLKSIGKEAFLGCENLQKIKFPDTVEFLDEFAFFGCCALKKVKLTNPNLRLSMQVFKMCAMLTSVELPEGLREVSYQAFKDCESLEEITIPRTVKIVGEYAFEFCMSLKDIHFLGKNTQIARDVFLHMEEVTVHCVNYSNTYYELRRINQPPRLHFIFFENDGI